MSITRNIVVDGSPFVIMDAPVDPAFKSGVRIASFRIANTEYSAGQITINVHGATRILYANVRDPASTAMIALTESAITEGRRLLTASIGTPVTLMCFIVYETEVS